ncbi:MAG: hypothetical protein HYZ11_11085 [Candidatus Tectomicrobia bacterium]|uniref:WLM domain-containing protein n=1 Tax=Tectimicrobiota bacterium TaxID=2528274 RepID=A0A932HZY6_UNCTE|nr:hypothetical protein [Candidatus Tectomicrobia bacterium]
MRKRRDTPDFVRSSKILRTSYHPGAEERALAGRLLGSQRASEREALGQLLLSGICQKMRIPPVRLRVIETPQPHTLRGGRLAAKLYGVYHFEEQLIQIAHYTAIREKVVAGKTFFDTLIHEFMHHLDRKHYRIPSTPHSPGFYSRIEDLKAKLYGPGRPVGKSPEEERWARPPKGLLAALEEAREAARQGEAPGEAEEAPPPPPRRPRWTPPGGNSLFPDAPPSLSAAAGSRTPSGAGAGAPRPASKPRSSHQLTLAFGDADGPP